MLTLDAMAVGLIAPMVALAVSIFTILVTTRLAIDKERRQLIWAKELDQFFALEELSGQLVEELAGPGTLDQASVGPMMAELRRAVGRFTRYGKVCQATRQLQNTVDRMLQPRIAGAVDFAHATGADAVLDFKPARHRTG
jgi:hypothetical protein